MRVPLAVAVALALAAAAPAADAAQNKPNAVIAEHPPTAVLDPDASFAQAAVLNSGTAIITYESTTASHPVLYACRLPRRATRCAAKVRLEADEPFEAAPVLVPDPEDEPDEVKVVYSAKGAGTAVEGSTFVRSSHDGGKTWDPRVKVADGLYQIDHAIVGPGAFRFSAINYENVQAAPFDLSDGPSAGVAKLWPSFPYESGLAAVDGTTPVALHADSAGDVLDVQTRRFTGLGDANDPSAWTSAQRFRPTRGVRDVVSLTGAGPRGAYLGFLEDKKVGCGGRFVVSRYDKAAGTFGPGVPVDPDRHAQLSSCDYGDTVSPGEPVQLTGDAAGVLYAVWSFNAADTDAGRPDGMYQSTSIDGGATWSAPKLLYRYLDKDSAGRYIVSVTAREMAANTTGDVLVVGGNELRVFWLTGVKNGGGGAAGCPTSVRFGAVRAIATQGCFAKTGSTYTATAPIRVNGIDLDPPGNAQRARAAGPGASASGKIVLDPSKGTITATGSVHASAGAVDLGRQAINWKVPAGGGRLLDAVTGQPARLDASEIKQRVLGMPVSGWVLPSFTAGGQAKLPLNLQVPSPIGGFTGGPLTDNIELPTDNLRGIVLKKNSIKIEMPTVSLGLAEISPFRVVYEADPYVFRGDLGIKLPAIESSIDGSFVFRDGDFVDATADFTPPTPGIPIAGPVFLTKIGLNVHKGRTCTDATSLAISGQVAGGPQVAGAKLVTVDGTARYAMPERSCDRPGVFTINGDGALAGLDVATVNLKYVTTGMITFGAAVKLGSDDLGVQGRVDGGIAFNTGDAYARGRATVTVAGYEIADVDAIVGTVGIGACAELDPLPPVPVGIDAGAKYIFGRGFRFYVDNCDISDLVPSVFQNAARARTADARATATRVITVRKGTKKQSFQAIAPAGAGAPQFDLVGPRGERFRTPTPQAFIEKSGSVAGFASADNHQSGITVTNPSPGAWQMVPLPDSPPIASAEGAAAYTPAKVTARVRRGKGRRRTIVYRATVPHGAKLRFFEAGAGTTHKLGAGHTGRGTVSFRAADGTRGTRGIVARVEGETGPMLVKRVASFRSPGPIVPARPRHVQLLRGSRNALRIAWSRSAGAHRYLVRVVLKDGRKLEFLGSGKRRSMVLKTVPAYDTGRVLVYGVGRNGQTSKPRAGTLHKAKVKHKKHKKKKHKKKKHKKKRAGHARQR